MKSTSVGVMYADLNGMIWIQPWALCLQWLIHYTALDPWEFWVQHRIIPVTKMSIWDSNIDCLEIQHEMINVKKEPYPIRMVFRVSPVRQGGLDRNIQYRKRNKTLDFRSHIFPLITCMHLKEIGHRVRIFTPYMSPRYVKVCDR